MRCAFASAGAGARRGTSTWRAVGVAAAASACPRLIARWRGRDPSALTSLHAGVVSYTDLDPRFTVSHK